MIPRKGLILCSLTFSWSWNLCSTFTYIMEPQLQNFVGTALALVFLHKTLVKDSHTEEREGKFGVIEQVF